MTDDLQIRLSNLRPAYARDGQMKTLATFDLELGEAIRLRRCRLTVDGNRFDAAMPDRSGAALVDNAVRSAVINAARRLYEEQRPGALAA